MDISVKKTLTRDDVIRGGACYDGVYDWCDRFARAVTALSTKVALKLCKSADHREYILRAAGLGGSGSGSGSGDGSGYGDGGYEGED